MSNLLISFFWLPYIRHAALPFQAPGFLPVGFNEDPCSADEVRVAPHEDGAHSLRILETHEAEHAPLLARDPHVAHWTILPAKCRSTHNT